jgi:glucan biosynthesis protein C
MPRRHDLDALRVFALLSLIAYHCAMLYVAEWDWHLKSSYLQDWLQWPMLAMNRWRMPLLFLVSGLAIGLFQPWRAPGRFALTRTWRLFVPLVFGMLVTVPIQPYCEGVANGDLAPGFWNFMLSYWGVQPFPPGLEPGRYDLTWNHLWYLAYLWLYTLALTVLLPVLESGPGRRLQAWAGALRGWKLVLLPALPLVLWLTVLLPVYGDADRNFVDDWFRNAEYFTVFLYGYVFARSTGFWDELLRLRRPLLWGALAMMAAYVSLVKSDLVFPEPALVAVRVLRGLFMWTTLLAILAWSRHLLDRPFRWLPYASEAVFPWYVIHQTATVLIAFWLVPMELGAPLEAFLVVGGTIVACVLGHELVRRVGVLRPLFGLKRRTASGRPQPEALAVVGGRE